VEHYLYDNTVDESRQRSLEKALAIFEKQQQKNKTVSERIVKRPEVSTGKGVFVFVVVLAILFLLSRYALSFYIQPTATRMLVVLAVGATVCLINSRKIIVWLILVYQKWAPDKIRLACVFEPSCSEYMLIAIDKYGVVHGVSKGIKRLLRCRHPNNGVDNP
jgi:putative component of membrane protein insertase Oxa1/YidC/SpoIIIJ protein YidD